MSSLSSSGEQSACWSSSDAIIIMAGPANHWLAPPGFRERPGGTEASAGARHGPRRGSSRAPRAVGESFRGSLSFLGVRAAMAGVVVVGRSGVSPSGPETSGVRGPCRTVAALVCASRQLLRSAAWQNPARQHGARLRRSGGSGPCPLDVARPRRPLSLSLSPTAARTGDRRRESKALAKHRNSGNGRGALASSRTSLLYRQSKTSPVHHSLGRFLSEQPLRWRDLASLRGGPLW
jgi:hypothetical protein